MRISRLILMSVLAFCAYASGRRDGILECHQVQMHTVREALR